MSMDSIGQALMMIYKKHSVQSSSDIEAITSMTPEEAQKKMNELKVKSVNESQGYLSGWNCTKCNNRGYIAYLREDGDGFYTSDCSCMKARRSIYKMEQSGLKDVIHNYTFEKYNVSNSWQSQAKMRAECYAQKPDGWFCLLGQSGAGKSHLCTAICRYLLLANKQVSYMAWRNEIDKLKSYDYEERFDHIDEFKNAQFLYIDDLFKIGAAKDGNVKPTSNDISIAYEIINHRYINHLPTIITSEFLINELLEIDEAIAGRIVEMCNDNLMQIGRGVSQNYRLRNKKV